MPGCEDKAQRHRNAGLKSHSAGDVREREMVLALAYPDDRVVFLGQFRRERTQDQRKNAGTHAGMPRKQDDLIDEDPRAEQDCEYTGAHLDGRDRIARIERVAAREPLEMKSLLHDGVGAAGHSEHRNAVSNVGQEHDSGCDVAQNGAWVVDAQQDQCQQDGHKESQVTSGVFPRYSEGRVAAPTPEGKASDTHHEQGDRREHQRRPNNRADADRAMRIGAGPAHNQRDQRDKSFGKGGADGGQQAPYSSFGDIKPLAGPFYAVGKKLRTSEDKREAKDQENRMFEQKSLPPPSCTTCIRMVNLILVVRTRERAPNRSFQPLENGRQFKLY